MLGKILAKFSELGVVFLFSVYFFPQPDFYLYTHTHVKIISGCQQCIFDAVHIPRSLLNVIDVNISLHI